MEKTHLATITLCTHLEFFNLFLNTLYQCEVCLGVMMPLGELPVCAPLGYFVHAQ